MRWLACQKLLGRYYLKFESSRTDSSRGRLLQALEPYLRKPQCFQWGLFLDFHFENSEFDKSIINYNLIIDEYKYSEYISYSFLNRATSYFNLKSYDQAEDDYLYVLKNISDEKIQSQAILGMQKIVSFTNNFTQLNSLITEYKNRFPDNDNVLKIQFDNIRNLYFNQKYDDLISYVNEIFSQEEQIFNEYETNYYLAESFFKTKKYEKASPVYETLLDSVNSKYFSRSLNRLAQINLNQKNYAA